MTDLTIEDNYDIWKWKIKFTNMKDEVETDTRYIWDLEWDGKIYSNDEPDTLIDIRNYFEPDEYMPDLKFPNTDLIGSYEFVSRKKLSTDKEIKDYLKRTLKNNTGYFDYYFVIEDTIQDLIDSNKISGEKTEFEPYPPTIPTTDNRVDFIDQRITQIRNLLIDETDGDKKKILMKAIQTLVKKIPEAIELDDLDRERYNMEFADYETKQYNKDVKDKEKQLVIDAKKKEEKRLQDIEDAKLLLTPEEVKQQIKDGKKTWITIRKKPYIAVQLVDKDPYGGSIKSIKNIKYFLPDKIYKTWNSKEVIDPNTLEIMGNFKEEMGGFKLELNELGKQRLEEYKTSENPNWKEDEAILQSKKAEEQVKRVKKEEKEYKKVQAKIALEATPEGKEKTRRKDELFKLYNEIQQAKDLLVFNNTKKHRDNINELKIKYKTLTNEYKEKYKSGKGIKSCWKGYEAIGMKQKGNKLVPNCVPIVDNINTFSNYEKAKKNAIKYLGKKVDFKISDKKAKKFMVFNPEKNKWIYFGQMGYEDFLKHQDPIRRNAYLKRTANIKGDWKNDKYSPNNLARNILW
jgi:hypothetical protein